MNVLLIFALFVFCYGKPCYSKPDHFQHYQSFVFREQDIETWWLSRTLFIKDFATSFKQDFVDRNEDLMKNLTSYSKDQSSLIVRNMLELVTMLSLHKEDITDDLSIIRKNVVEEIEHLKSTIKTDLQHLEVRLAYRMAFYNRKMEDFSTALSDCKRETVKLRIVEDDETHFFNVDPFQNTPSP